MTCKKKYDETFEDMAFKARIEFKLTPIEFLKKVQSIILEAHEKVIEKEKLPKDFIFDTNIIIGVTEDDYTFMCRMDLLDVKYKPESYLEDF
jgi:hypothetical protein